MFLKIKKNNQGTALILTILIAGVLFALSSFLISQVLINTKMIKKATSDEESYGLAKAGIFYAIDRLNNRMEEVPDYDSMDWPGHTNWIELDLDNKDGDSDATTGDKECRVRVDKDDLPQDAFSLSSDNSDTGYLTIESQDIKKKVTLQAVAESKSPLTEYVRFIGSVTTFDNTFGSSRIIQGDAPFCVLGDLTWQGTNDLITTGNNTAVYGNIYSTGTLTINNNSPDAGHYYTDLSNPKSFNTADGYYFDQAHLPSGFDYTDGDPGDPASFYCGNLAYKNPKSVPWPKIINEKKGEATDNNKYKDLATTDGIYIDGSPINESDEWYDCSTGWEEETLHGWKKTYEGSETYFYTGTGTLVVLDGNGETSGTPGQVGIDDDSPGEEGCNEIGEDEWYPYPSNGVIYSPGNIRILGMIGNDNGTPSDPSDDTPYNLTIASGGTIYIEGNLIKGTDGSSLALLAKDWVVLNPTHKFTSGRLSEMEANTYSPEGVTWKPFDPDPEGNSWGIKVLATGEEIYTIGVFDLGYRVFADTIILKSLSLHADWELKIYVSNNKEWDKVKVETNDTLFGGFIGAINNKDKTLISDNPLTFKYIKIWLHTESSNAAAPFDVNTITTSLSGGGDGMWNGEPLVNGLFYAQEQSWAIISGDESPPLSYCYWRMYS